MVTHPHHPLHRQQVMVSRVRRGPDPDLISRFPAGFYGAISAGHAAADVAMEAGPVCADGGGTGSPRYQTLCDAWAGVWSVSTAPRPLQGEEAMPRFRQGQIEGLAKGQVLAQHPCINQRFAVAAERALTSLSSHAHEFLQHNRAGAHKGRSGNWQYVGKTGSESEWNRKLGSSG
jgi:hypothetical protein